MTTLLSSGPFRRPTKFLMTRLSVGSTVCSRLWVFILVFSRCSRPLFDTENPTLPMCMIPTFRALMTRPPSMLWVSRSLAGRRHEK